MPIDHAGDVAAPGLKDRVDQPCSIEPSPLIQQSMARKPKISGERLHIQVTTSSFNDGGQQ